ncbi:MAG: aminopeptidase [Desulfobacterium sp.]|nr:aminopeptidase [Desulfobacterium sp.]
MKSKDIYEQYNETYRSAYESHLNALHGIVDGAKKEANPHGAYFEATGTCLIQASLLEADLEAGTRGDMDLELLKKENLGRYRDLLPENYGKSFANPAFCLERYGAPFGPLLSYIHMQARECFTYAHGHKRFKMAGVFSLFIRAHGAVKNHDVTALKQAVTDYRNDQIPFDSEALIRETHGAQNMRLTDITLTADLSDLRYLYDYGVYITDHEIQTAGFLSSYPKEKLEKLADTIVKAYMEGFRRENKDMSLRHNVRIVANAGQERLTRRIVELMKENHLNGYVGEIVTTAINRQCGYDHKFDVGLYLTDAYVRDSLDARREKALAYESLIRDYSGVLFVERFGEAPFSPKGNSARVTLDPEQQGLFQKLMGGHRQLIEAFIPEKERSFCIVAFPTPEIGERFEAIFEDTARINMQSSAAFEPVQKRIIDALDQGSKVHVLGRGNNETDIIVALGHLENPEKQTNFANCVADVNIPVGEVFTSPVLKNTGGLLHLEKVYLDGFNYTDLRLTFKDGYVTDYTCANFEDEAENKKYIQENLLFPHETLPLGEFAIGTNTLAYVIAGKYEITDQLPILIVEKMGPHFALGDTCFSFGEDNPVYNAIDGKEIVARDNERSILRKEDVSKAYTNCHTDITLPYDGLAKIAVLTDAGDEIEIIRDGRFVLNGTEMLNTPFDQK